jgi:hypothetical protein
MARRILRNPIQFAALLLRNPMPLLGSNSCKWSTCKNIFRLNAGADLDFICLIDIMLHPGKRGQSICCYQAISLKPPLGPDDECNADIPSTQIWLRRTDYARSARTQPACWDQRFSFGSESRFSRDVPQSGKICAMECATKAGLCRRLSRRVNMIARRNPVKAPRNASVMERLLNVRSPWLVRMNPVYAMAAVQRTARTANMGSPLDEQILRQSALSE